jgi:multiple sugar transport system substrate-binding protein
MFEQRGIPAGRNEVPTTWDELRRLSKEFTYWTGERLEIAGFIPWHTAEDLPIWSALNGSQLYDAANRRYMLDAEPNVAMMTYAMEWLEEEYQGDFATVMRAGNWEGYEIEGRQPAIREQRQAMVLTYSWNIGTPVYTQSSYRWDIAPFPVGPGGQQTVAGYWPNWLVIPKGARHVGPAFTWLDYLSGVGVKEWFHHFPDLPTNRQVPRDLLPTALVATKGEVFARHITNFFREQLDAATPMWDSPVQDFATDQIKRALEQMMYKVAKPKEALAEAQKACQGALERVFKIGT